jgi:spore photoproduct lyase
MFERIFVEREVKDQIRAKEILKSLGRSDFEIIEKIDDIFGKVKKPYLQKREALNLFIGKKRGSLVKKAPDAYGVLGDPHFYFIHAYNCIYECQYCYLQGYFNSPDLVFFINHEEICQEIEKMILEHKNGIWFHAGEFSDSLALSHLTGELPVLFDLFKRYPKAYLELRTKSVNIKELLKLKPIENIITSFSLSPAESIKEFDLKTPPLKHRLNAISKLHQSEHPIGIHFDPIIFEENFEDQYRYLVDQLKSAMPLEKIRYVSLGVVRFTKNVYHQMKKNYPDSSLLAENFTVSFDNKVRYIRPKRLWILQTVKKILMENGIVEDKIYLCMEKDQ